METNLEFIQEMIHKAQQSGQSIVFSPDGTVSVLGKVKPSQLKESRKITAPLPEIPLFAKDSWLQFGCSKKINRKLEFKAELEERKENRKLGEMVWDWLKAEGSISKPDELRQYRNGAVGSWAFQDGDIFFADEKTQHLVEFVHNGVAWFDSLIADGLDLPTSKITRTPEVIGLPGKRFK